MFPYCNNRLWDRLAVVLSIQASVHILSEQKRTFLKHIPIFIYFFKKEISANVHVC